MIFIKIFLKSDVDLQLEFANYIKDPVKYSETDSCDIYLIALAKSYAVNITMIQCDVEKCWGNKFLDINPSGKNILYFARSLSNHVDPILPVLKDTVVKAEIDYLLIYPFHFNAHNGPKSIFQPLPPTRG